jgi:hypothetical protein
VRLRKRMVDCLVDDALTRNEASKMSEFSLEI